MRPGEYSTFYISAERKHKCCNLYKDSETPKSTTGIQNKNGETGEMPMNKNKVYVIGLSKQSDMDDLRRKLEK